MAEDGLAPADLAVDGGGVRVEQELGRVAAQALARVPGAVDPKPVALARADAGQAAVPNVGRALGQLDAVLGAVVVEEADLDSVGDLRRHREVGAVCADAGAKRVGASRLGFHHSDKPFMFGGLGRLVGDVLVSGSVRWMFQRPPGLSARYGCGECLGDRRRGGSRLERTAYNWADHPQALQSDGKWQRPGEEMTCRCSPVSSTKSW